MTRSFLLPAASLLALACMLGAALPAHAQSKRAPRKKQPPVLLGSSVDSTRAKPDSGLVSVGDVSAASDSAAGSDPGAAGATLLGAPVDPAGTIYPRVAGIAVRLTPETIEAAVDDFRRRNPRRHVADPSRLLGDPVELADDAFLSEKLPSRAAAVAAAESGAAATEPAPRGLLGAPAAAVVVATSPPPAAGDSPTRVLGAPVAAEAAATKQDTTGASAGLVATEQAAAAKTAEPAGPRVLGTAAPPENGTSPTTVTPDSAGPKPLGRPAEAGEADRTTVRAPRSALLGEPAPAVTTVPASRTTLAFREDQLTYPRVIAARAQKESVLRSLFAEKGLTYPAAELYFRVFKRERVLEVWARDAGGGAFTLLKAYPTCNNSGRLGPKRRQGDLQIPEGFYTISGFNPYSAYHLSMQIDYPNASDRRLGAQANWGGDIFIHGDCVTVGCVAVTNDQIKEIYWLAVEARAAGQVRIPIHIFPARLDGEGMAWLDAQFGADTRRMTFWDDLRPAYEFFEASHEVPDMTVDPAGRYRIRG